MNIVRIIRLACLSASLAPSLVAAQTNNLAGIIGAPTDATQYEIPGVGFVNLNNGNLHIEMPLSSIKDRDGKTYGKVLVYDSSGYQTVQVPAPNGSNPSNTFYAWAAFPIAHTPYINDWNSGLRVNTLPSYSGNVMWTSKYIQSGTTCGGSGGNTYSSFQYIDGHGTVHPFSTSATTGDSTLFSCGYPSGVQAGATDGSGYWLVVTNQTSATVYDVHGNIVSGAVKDTNGNLLSGDGLGRSIGLYPPFWSATYKTIYVWTKFNFGGQEIGFSPSGGQGTTTGAISVSVLSTLTNPDGYQYIFDYDDAGAPQGPNGTFLSTQQGHYGELIGITLPTGGHITIQNVVQSNFNVPVAIHSIQTPDGTWNFSYGAGPTTTVTAPPDSKTGLQSQTTCACSFYSTGTKTVSTYSGSATGTPLRTIQIQYSAIGHPSVITTTLDGVFSSKVAYTYPDTCTPRISSKKEYDSAGNILRETHVSFYTSAADNTGLCTYGSPTFTDSYLQNGHHIVDISSDVEVYDIGGAGGSNPPFAQTNYTYDATTLYSTSSYASGNSVLGLTDGSGHSLHDDANFGTSMAKRGNLTGISQMVSQGTFITTQTNYYNILGELVRTVDGNGNPTTYDYTDHWNPHTTACITSPSFAYPTTITNAVGQAATSTYNSCDGSVASVTDPNGAQWSYTYDRMQRVETTSSPGGFSSSNYSFGGSLPFTASTDTSTSAGARTDAIYYDSLGRESTYLQNNFQIEVLKQYDSLGRLASVSNPFYGGQQTYGVTKYYFDALGRNTSQIDSDGVSAQTWMYYGNLSTFADESGNQWQYTTDALGRLGSVLEPNGTSRSPSMDTDYTYNPLDNLVQIDQWGGAKSSGPNHQRKFSYDRMSRLTQSFNPETGWTCNGTTPSNAAANGTNCTPAYDSSGNLTAKTDARGVKTAYSYDGLNRVNQKTYSDGTPTAKFGYDGKDVNGASLGVTNAKGRLSQSASGSYSSTYSYDPVGRVLNKTACIPGDCAGHVSIAATYDNVGNVQTLTSGLTTHPITWTYAYDTLSRLQTITAGTSVDSMTKLFDATSLNSYGPEGLENASLGFNSTTNQPLVTLQHRVDARLRSIFSGYYNTSGAAIYTYCMPGSLNANCSGTGDPYYANGNLSKVIDSVNGTWNYGYDTLNRLVTGTASSGSNSGKTACWTYDSFGNRTSESLSTTACNNNPPLTSWASYTTSNTNRMDSTSTNSAQASGYDGAGNENFDGVNHYLYDAEGRICAFYNYLAGPTATITYMYDAEGNRIGKGTNSIFACSGGTTTAGIVVGLDGKQLTEITGSGAWDHSNVFADGQLLATYKSSHLYFSLNDWLGTRRAEVSSSCATTTYGNLPFGNALTTTGGCPYATEQHFTGKERDSNSGNDYFGARYLTSGFGRFLSPDPSELFFAVQANPQTLNLYNYVQNNPLRNVDRDGRRCVWDDGSFDSEDDKQTSKKGDCEAAGGEYFRPGTYSPGTDWASVDSDGTLTLHERSHAVPESTYQPGTIAAGFSFATSSLSGWVLDQLKTPVNYGYNPQPHRFFSTWYCGRGGAGPSNGASGVLNSRCAMHDSCFDNLDISAASNAPGGPPMSNDQKKGAKVCNQSLYNAARANSSETGADALRWWLVEGSHPPFGASLIAPGTEAKQW